MIYKEFSEIKAIVLDVDGVLTNGVVQVNEQGHQLRSFHVKDGYAVQLAVKSGLPIFVISGAKSEGVRMRMESLGVREIHLGISDKLSILNKILESHQLAFESILFIGDDIPDYQAMKVVGIAACPSDAVEEIKNIAHYISPKAGGNGAVRDIIEKVLKIQGKWSLDNHIKSV